MKKLVFGFLAFGLASLCNAQTSGKKEEAKFPPPVIEKKVITKPATKAKAAPPMVKKAEEAKPAPTVIKRSKPVKKNAKVKSAPPVIIKEESTD